MRLIKCLVIAAAVASLTACPKTKTPMPSALKDKLIDRRVNDLTRLASEYDNAVTRSEFTKAQLYRNEMVYQSLLLVGTNYNDFENDLFVGRATSNVLMDITELGVAAATGITNGERVKSILAISLTAFKGGRKSLETNFFRERTTEIIVLKMRAARARVRQTIRMGLGLPVQRYPLGAAIDDIVNYLGAGSINSALLELAQDTGEDAKNARARAAESKIAPFLTQADADGARRISDAREALRGRVFSADANTRIQGSQELIAILGQITDPASLAGKTPEQLFDILVEKIEASRDDKDLRAKIMKAFKLTQ